MPDEGRLERRLPVRAAGRLLRDHAALLLALATGTATLCGISYHRAFLARLGFESLLFQLPPQTYLFTGFVALLVSTAFVAIAAVIVAMIMNGFAAARDSFASRAPKEAAPADGPTRDDLPSPHGPWWGAVAVMSVLPLPWLWVGNMFWMVERGRMLMALAGLALFASVAAARKLRGRGLAVFYVALMLACAPVITEMAGESEADRLLEFPGAFTQVRVWTNGSEEPMESLVLVHRDTEWLYLVEVWGADASGTLYWRAFSLATREVDRLHYVAPGSGTYWPLEE